MIGENLQQLRKRARFSQEQVAERIGVSRQAVAKWESGETTPDLPNCVALANLYDVTLDELVHHASDRVDGLPVPPKGKHVFGTVTVGDKGQIVIPVRARRLFGIGPGDSLIVLGDEHQGGLALMKQSDFLALAEAIRRMNGGGN